MGCTQIGNRYSRRNAQRLDRTARRRPDGRALTYAPKIIDWPCGRAPPSVIASASNLSAADQRAKAEANQKPQTKLDSFVACAPLRKRFAFVAGNDGRMLGFVRCYWVLTRARHRDSKLSSSSIRACASMEPLRFSVTTVTGGATLTLACAGAAAGHFSNDFEIMVLPAYQHFRPSIRRQDQCPCVLDGEATHSLICALACAVSMPIGASAAMQTAKKKSRICIFIGHSPCG